MYNFSISIAAVKGKAAFFRIYLKSSECQVQQSDVRIWHTLRHLVGHCQIREAGLDGPYSAGLFCSEYGKHRYPLNGSAPAINIQI